MAAYAIACGTTTAAAVNPAGTSDRSQFAWYFPSHANAGIKRATGDWLDFVNVALMIILTISRVFVYLTPEEAIRIPGTASN
jgi:hypothetical protein